MYRYTAGKPIAVHTQLSIQSIVVLLQKNQCTQLLEVRLKKGFNYHLFTTLIVPIQYLSTKNVREKKNKEWFQYTIVQVETIIMQQNYYKHLLSVAKQTLHTAQLHVRKVKWHTLQTKNVSLLPLSTWQTHTLLPPLNYELYITAVCGHTP